MEEANFNPVRKYACYFLGKAKIGSFPFSYSSTELT